MSPRYFLQFTTKYRFLFLHIKSVSSEKKSVCCYHLLHTIFYINSRMKFLTQKLFPSLPNQHVLGIMNSVRKWMNVCNKITLKKRPFFKSQDNMVWSLSSSQYLAYKSQVTKVTLRIFRYQLASLDQLLQAQHFWLQSPCPLQCN